MTEPSNEERVAEAVLGFDDQGNDRIGAASPDRDDATRRIERDMQETVSTLKDWRRQLEAQPVRLPVVRRHASWAWPVGIAAALAIGFGLNFWTMYHGNTETIARELEWTTQSAVASDNGPVREVTVHVGRREAGAGVVTGRLAVSRNARTSHPQPEFNSVEGQDIRRNVAFAFHTPDRLPGSLTLRSAEAVSSNRVRLVYAGTGETMAVFLSSSPGPDIAVRAVRIGERTLMAGRRHGVLAAFEASSRPACDWNVLLRDLVNGDQAGG